MSEAPTACRVCGGVTFRQSGTRWRCSRCLEAAQERYRRKHGPAVYLLANARTRARRLGVPCTITKADIRIPATCPVLGIPISVAPWSGRRGPHPNSPSLDRIWPELGYTPGNVRVISHRANMLKNSATIGELEAVLAYMRSITIPRYSRAQGE